MTDSEHFRRADLFVRNVITGIQLKKRDFFGLRSEIVDILVQNETLAAIRNLPSLSAQFELQAAEIIDQELEDEVRAQAEAAVIIGDEAGDESADSATALLQIIIVNPNDMDIAAVNHVRTVFSEMATEDDAVMLPDQIDDDTSDEVPVRIWGFRAEFTA
jgi:hypothetical protein